MLNNKHLKDWSCTVSQHLPHLSLLQVRGLATWSFGCVMTRSSSLTQVSNFIAQLNQEQPNTVRQRLKEWYLEAPLATTIAFVADTIPAHFQVIVTADRGLYADWLYHMIERVGWHPFLRINHQGTYRLPQQQTWKPLAGIVERPGQSWSGRVVCFKTNPLACTLLFFCAAYPLSWLIYSTTFPFISIVGATSLTLLLTLFMPATLPNCKKPTPVSLRRGGLESFLSHLF